MKAKQQSFIFEHPILSKPTIHPYSESVSFPVLRITYVISSLTL